MRQVLKFVMFLTMLLSVIILPAKAQFSIDDRKPAPISTADVQSRSNARLAGTVRILIGSCITRQFNIGAFGGHSTERLTVNFKIELNRDGTFASEPQITPNGGDQDARNILAHQAYDALFACQEVFKKLPLDEYDQWRTLGLNFSLPKVDLR